MRQQDKQNTAIDQTRKAKACNCELHLEQRPELRIPRDVDNHIYVSSILPLCKN